MKVLIARVSKEYDLIRLSFESVCIRDIILSEEAYVKLGKPTVNDVVEVTISYEGEKR